MAKKVQQPLQYNQGSVVVAPAGSGLQAAGIPGDLVPVDQWGPFKVGMLLYFRTATFHNIGPISKIWVGPSIAFAEIHEPLWVASCGIFPECIMDGKVAEGEILKGNTVWVNLYFLNDAITFHHEWPLKAVR